MTTIKTRKANRIPGSTELVLMAQATDSNGRVWAKGTHLVPLSGGFDNAVGTRYQDCSVLPSGERVRFHEGMSTEAAERLAVAETRAHRLGWC